MNFRTEHGTWEQRPPEIDFNGCPGKVYVRKNIRQETVKVGEDEITEWVCETALMTYEEFASYSQAEIIKKQLQMDEAIAEVLLNQMEV